MKTEPVPVTPGQLTVAVIGAGAAGIKAVRDLALGGAHVIWIEARERLGGRGLTDASLGVPIDLGARWLHNVWESDPENPHSNPWYPVARYLHVATAEDDNTNHLYQGADPTSQIDEMWERYDEVESAIVEAGNQGQDVPAAEVRPSPPGTYDKLVDTLLGPLEESIELACFSTLDRSRVRSQGTNLIAPTGFGKLMADYATAVLAAYGKNISLRQPAEAQIIYWGGPVVLIEAKHPKSQDVESILADAVVVTVPTGCITAEDGLRFEPELPKETRDALGNLPLGHYTKVALLFNQKLADQSANYTLYQNEDRLFRKLTLNLDGSQVAVGYVGGQAAAELRENTPEKWTELMRNELCEVFGAGLKASLVGSVVGNWSADRYSRGAYSYMRPGGGNARQILATPVERRIFFAGEACAVTAYGSAHGAFCSGRDAAERVLSAWGFPRR